MVEGVNSRSYRQRLARNARQAPSHLIWSARRSSAGSSCFWRWLLWRVFRHRHPARTRWSLLERDPHRAAPIRCPRLWPQSFLLWCQEPLRVQMLRGDSEGGFCIQSFNNRRCHRTRLSKPKSRAMLATCWEAAIEAAFHGDRSSAVFSARSASVSHRSAISMKRDLCSDVRAASANRMQSAALLRNRAKMSKCASMSLDMGTVRALCRRMLARSSCCRRSAGWGAPGIYSRPAIVVRVRHAT